MKRDEILKEISLGESKNFIFRNYITFDNNKLIKVIGKDVCAFLNSGGGHIVVEIDPNAEVGFPQQMTSFLNDISRNISPSALFSQERINYQDKQIFVVEVPAGKDIPYAYNNTIYIRDLGKTIIADNETVRDMVFRRQIEPERWERRFSSADLEMDLSKSELRKAAEQVKNKSFPTYKEDEIPTKVLEYFSVIKYGRLTNAGDILFGTNPALRYPQIRTKAVRFISDKTDNQYPDMDSFEGPLVTMLEELYSFIIRNIPQKSDFINNNLQRIDGYQYPPSAIREGLVNALVHRDYSQYSGGVRVAIYLSRLEIWNSGSFPNGVSAETIGTSRQISVLRNPDIAQVLYLRGFMEKLGRGSEMIRQSCREGGLPGPKWMSDGNGVTLIFYTTEVNTEVNMEVNTEVNTEVMRVIEKIAGEMSRQTLQDLLDLKNDEYFRKAYMEPSLRTGVIEMTIPDKPTSRMQKYRITELGKNLKMRKGK